MCSCRKDESNKDNEKSETSVPAIFQAYLNETEDAIKNVSPQFVENVKIVIEKYQDNILVMTMLVHNVSEQNMLTSQLFVKWK